jgi:proline iminopeptidase
MEINMRWIPLLGGLWLFACSHMPATVAHNPELPNTEINGYAFHTGIYGSAEAEKVIVIHGGPGGEFGYLLALKALADDYQVIFYDQRGSGLSPRVASEELTLEQNVADLAAIIDYFSPHQPVRLVGHSWGAMLAAAYIDQQPQRVSHAVLAEPGMLNPEAAVAFVDTMRTFQSFWDNFVALGYIIRYPFIEKKDGHEGFDFVMTALLNRNNPGPPYQCQGQQMPEASFRRAGFEAFNAMLRPVFDEPESFSYNLTQNMSAYGGELMLLSSSCSAFGYDFQERWHRPLLPSQCQHVLAPEMGHNMLSLNAEWSVQQIRGFFASACKQRAESVNAE